MQNPPSCRHYCLFQTRWLPNISGIIQVASSAVLVHTCWFPSRKSRYGLCGLKPADQSEQKKCIVIPATWTERIHPAHQTPLWRTHNSWWVFKIQVLAYQVFCCLDPRNNRLSNSEFSQSILPSCSGLEVIVTAQCNMTAPLIERQNFNPCKWQITLSKVAGFNYGQQTELCTESVHQNTQMWTKKNSKQPPKTPLTFQVVLTGFVTAEIH